jgi:hypothetical protein
LAADVDRRLRRRPALAAKLRTRSFANDLLIAASARELGAVILTENMDDFGLISSVLDIRCVQPWPDEPPDPADVGTPNALRQNRYTLI